MLGGFSLKVEMEQAGDDVRIGQIVWGLRPAVGGENGPVQLAMRVGKPGGTLAELALQVVVPAHCTGWRATHALAAALPDAFVPGSVGTRYILQ